MAWGNAVGLAGRSCGYFVEAGIDPVTGERAAEPDCCFSRIERADTGGIRAAGVAEAQKLRVELVVWVADRRGEGTEPAEQAKGHRVPDHPDRGGDAGLGIHEIPERRAGVPQERRQLFPQGGHCRVCLSGDDRQRRAVVRHCDHRRSHDLDPVPGSRGAAGEGECSDSAGVRPGRSSQREPPDLGRTACPEGAMKSDEDQDRLVVMRGAAAFGVVLQGIQA
jgi:hypothetical protein